MRRWTPGPGHFQLATPARVVVLPSQAEVLVGEATQLAADLRAVIDGPVRVDVVDRPRDGDVLLRLGAPGRHLGREGYRLAVGRAAAVSAHTPTGVFYGGRTLLQLLAQHRRLPAGTGHDWPRYPERGLMLDIGRKNLTYDWIVDRVREMAWLKLNHLHLHFTEDLGFRIESRMSPQVHSDVHLTKAQVRRLVELCARHHIQVVPEVDVPAHMGTALRNYPQLQLVNASGQAESTKLDYTLPAAREFVQDLVREYVELFPGRWFHLGFDEYVAEAQQAQYPQLSSYARSRFGPGANNRDGAIGFANDLVAVLRSRHRRARVYHDGTFGGATQRLDRRAVVEWWTDFSPLGLGGSLPQPQEILDAGHRVMNIGWYPTYYTNLPAYEPVPRPDLPGFYEDWRVHRFRGVLVLEGDLGAPYHDIDPGEPRNLGSRLSVWFDDPAKETQDQAAAGIRERLRIMAQQTWESRHLVPTYDRFAEIIDSVGPAPRG
jgi:hexosaminidase